LPFLCERDREGLGAESSLFCFVVYSLQEFRQFRRFAFHFSLRDGVSLWAEAVNYCTFFFAVDYRVNAAP
jgi:hypothetical protein